MAAAYAAMRPENVPRATSGLNVVQRVGGSIGGALLAVILNAQVSKALPDAASSVRDAVPSGDLDPFTGAVSGAFATTFWYAFWLTLAAIPAALILTHQERRARMAVTVSDEQRPQHG